MTTKIRTAFIETTSFKSAKSDKVYSGHYDFLLMSASWDKRSTVIAEANSLYAEYGLLFQFEKKDARGLSEAHQKTLETFLKSNIRNPASIQIEATLVHANWQLLKEQLWNACNSLRRPLDIFIDLSTTPRYLTLGVLGTGFSNGLVRSVTYGYSEGRYSESGSIQEIFTEGGWSAKAIPGLNGEWEPHQARHYVVSVGFEGLKTRQLITKNEPDRVSLLFPNPPVDKDYTKKTLTANQRLITDFNIENNSQMHAHAADVVATLKIMEDFNLEQFATENCMYVCCGTKPHSLAFAIRSLVKREPAVLYIVPESHSVVDVEPNGFYWQYKVTDCSSLRGEA